MPRHVCEPELHACMHQNQVTRTAEREEGGPGFKALLMAEEVMQGSLGQSQQHHKLRHILKKASGFMTLNFTVHMWCWSHSGRDSWSIRAGECSMHKTGRLDIRHV